MAETYLEKLEKWYQTELKEGRLVDLKMTLRTWEEQAEDLGRPLADSEKKASLERSAKAMYETLTGKRKSVDITHLRI
jgi:hypothetical protein